VPALISRVLVAAVGLPVVLVVVWAGGWWLFGLATFVALVALHEYARLIRPLRPLVLAAYVGAVAMLAGATAGGATWLLGGLLLMLAVTVVMHLFAETRPPATVAIGSTFLGAAWVGLGLGCVLLLRDIPDHGALAVFTVLLAVWASETFAFFVGRLVGRHKLAPVTSPGKTWEGLVAGSAASVAVAFFALYEDRETFLTIAEAVALGGAIALAGTLGDLFESALKRDMQVKDTGRLLAGHGGMLDRIDALLFAAPASLFAILAFGYA